MKPDYLEHRNYLVNYLSLISRDRLLAEDLVQSVLINYWINKPVVSNVRGYLKMMAKNAYIDYYRIKKLSIVDLEHAYSVNNDVNILREVEAKETLRSLKIEIEKFESIDRDIMLCLLEGYSLNEIAVNMNLNYNTVKVKVFRARKKLSAIL
jgi:RNA polymerase sigma factor (sigma-70 family)